MWIFNWQRCFTQKRILEKAVTPKRFEYLPLGEAFEEQTNVIRKQSEVINKNEDKRNKLLKTISGTDGKYYYKVENDFLYLAKEHVEKCVESDKRMKCEDLLCNFNRYGMIISFASNFFTEVTATEKM